MKTPTNIDLNSQIGITKSGKPIFMTFDNPNHKDFTSDDHEDAMRAQETLFQASFGSGERDGSQSFHYNEFHKHNQARD